LINDLDARTLERSLPAIPTLLPYFDPTGKYGWSEKDILVETASRNYTANDYQVLMQDANFTLGYQMREDAESALGNLGPPEVEIVCAHGSDLKTVASIRYENGQNLPNGKPVTLEGDGDDTVNLLSLNACQKFKDLQPQNFTYKVFPFEAHGGMLKTKKFLDYFKTYLENL